MKIKLQNSRESQVLQHFSIKNPALGILYLESANFDATVIVSPRWLVLA